ncbi:hypothetical protein SEA_TUNATARTARE_11 [Streptomyces phage TunaTartare]|jgi:hypothetical protein|uniref:Uncharacterized protein n=1 Tax=Streptomyces phage TunaTartare TaxID=2848887 RepID=A0A8F2E6T6_9CAUD|nr:hypothetical protein PP457_gp011 [Streptomyces phage TunaTartare]QWT29907.1 hypothetical protein SEA_TUNATARTARE_11 [Streptomyces phage TunaTartare]
MGPQEKIDKLLNKIRAQEQIRKNAENKKDELGVRRANFRISEYKKEIRRIQDTEL